MNLTTRVRTAAAGLLVALAALGLSAAPAAAHASYSGSDPADDSTVSAPPSQVWAEFTEPLAEGSHLIVYDPCGDQVDNGDSQVTAYRVTISMNAEAAGTYTVHFAVVSSLDSHPTRGSFNFTSSGGSPCPGE
ncbi:MAG: copper resistance protein CopC, partial [Actinomycetota bacterium]|nr:copper resistance protein CopC [Actinomycetota bacterium]